MTAYQVIKKLQNLGYKVEKKYNGKIKLTFQEKGKEPNPNKVQPLIGELKEKKKRALKILDPRPDLEADHHLWQQLLNETEKETDNLHWNLHGFRCEGCKLHETKGKIKLAPGSKLSKSKYKELRREYLIPHSKTIKEIFERVEKQN